MFFGVELDTGTGGRKGGGEGGKGQVGSQGADRHIRAYPKYIHLDQAR
jgi:hypothetical protein